MTGTGISLVGFNSLMGKLKTLDSKLDEKVQQIALEIERDAKYLCPVRTGRLRGSIHTGSLGKASYYVGTNVEYAPFVEFGTRKMTARPYLRPAAKKVVMRVKAKGISWWLG